MNERRQPTKGEIEAAISEAVTKYIPAVDPDELLPYAPSTGRPDLRAKRKDLLVQKNPTLEGRPFSLLIVSTGMTRNRVFSRLESITLHAS